MTHTALNSRSLNGNGLENLPLSQLHEWVDNPRRTHDPVKHAELVVSLRAQGLLQPLLVRPKAAGWEVVAGNRRRRALLEVVEGDGLVPCLVRDLSDDDALAAALKENGDRDDLLPMEEAATYERLLTGRPLDEVAALCGKSITHVRQRVKLLRLIPLARGLLSAGKLTASAALQLAQLTSPIDQARAILNLEFDLAFALEEKAVDAADPEALASMTVEDLVGVDFSKADTFQAVTTAEVRAAVRDLGRVLVRAPFPILDAELVPAAGACGACPHRTGAQASLFGGADDDDVCLDDRCWESKRAAADARLLDRAQREGRLITLDKTAKLWTKWGGLVADAPFVCLEDKVSWRVGKPYSEVITDDERKQIRVVVDNDGRAREVLPRAVADAILEREEKHDDADADDGGDDHRALVDAREKKRLEERDARDREVQAKAVLRKAAIARVADAWSASPAPDSVALAIAVAAAGPWGMYDELQIDRKVGGKQMVLLCEELVRRFDADRAGACRLVMNQLLARMVDEQDFVLDTLLQLVAGTTLKDFSEPPQKATRKRAATAASHRAEPDGDHHGDAVKLTVKVDELAASGSVELTTPKKRGRKKA